VNPQRTGNNHCGPKGWYVKKVAKELQRPKKSWILFLFSSLGAVFFSFHHLFKTQNQHSKRQILE
jgi:hypothetical protein